MLPNGKVKVRIHQDKFNDIIMLIDVIISEPGDRRGGKSCS